MMHLVDSENQLHLNLQRLCLMQGLRWHGSLKSTHTSKLPRKIVTDGLDGESMFHHSHQYISSALQKY
ncbi:hypothetical protein ILYODFUR_016534 [Ilyodon furcidens]|uniref:Uncharacterized protein n=1 Tax=Ilyodon furcidens TaxID=33524 RepID=A0ABV0UI26_9TELE